MRISSWLIAVLWVMGVALSLPAHGQSQGQGLGQGQAMYVPDMIQPGMRLTYQVHAVQHRPNALPDPDDPTISTNRSTGQVGYQVYDIIQVTREAVIAVESHWIHGLNYGGIHCFNRLPVAWTARSFRDNASMLWMPPQELAQLQTTGSMHIARAPWPVGNQQVPAVLVTVRSDPGGMQWIYDANNGVLLHRRLVSATDLELGRVVNDDDETLGTVWYRAQASASNTRLISTRMRNLPFAQAPLPNWAQVGAQLTYDGALTTSMQGMAVSQPFVLQTRLPEMNQNVALFSGTIQALNPQTGQPSGQPVPVQHLGGGATLLGLVMSPQGLAALRSGTLIDEDSILQNQLVYEIRQTPIGRLGFFNLRNAQGSYLASFGYDLQTGHLVYQNERIEEVSKTAEMQLRR